VKQGREVLHFLFASFDSVVLLTLDVQLLPMHVVYARLCQQLTARSLPIIRTESSCVFSAIYFNRWTEWTLCSSPRGSSIRLRVRPLTDLGRELKNDVSEYSNGVRH
jgi:hypothetical protein